MIDLQNIDDSFFQLGKSGRAVKLLYNKTPVQFCTSSLYTPFGIKSTIKDWSNFTEYYIDCSLNQSNSENAMSFRKSIEDLDEKIAELVKSNLSLFNSKNETANDNFVYSPILRENKTYPKLMKLQFPRDKNGNFESFIFDEQKQKIKLDDNNILEYLNKGKVFKCIIECSKIWYYNGKVGSIWNVVQLKFSDRSKPEDDTNNEGEGTNNTNNGYNEIMFLE
jgi:hypothetical protein